MSQLLRLFFLVFTVVILGISGIALAEQKKEKSVNEKILEILIEKQIITKEQYEDLKKQAMEEQAAQKPKIVAGYNKGFFLETADKKSKMKFDGRLQVDFKTFLGDSDGKDSFYVRRARLASSGTFFNYYDFRVEAEFGKGSAKLNDGFMNIRYIPEAQFQFGQFKVPFLMEELQSDNWIYFIERSLADSLAPSRDIGVMLHGNILNDLVYYQASVVNGYKLNEAEDADSGKDAAFRIVINPFKNTGSKVFQGLRLGGALTYGDEELTTSQWWNSGKFKTAAGTTYLALDSDVVQDGHRTRGNLELFWDWGSTAVMAEYAVTELEGLTLGDLKRDVGIQGGYLAVLHFITGEKFTFKNGIPARVVPLKKFQIGAPGWGAFQVGARIEFLKADNDILDLGFADSDRYTAKTSGFTIGLNWYPMEMVRIMVNYYHMDFDDDILVGGNRYGDEDVILTRFQTVF